MVCIDEEIPFDIPATWEWSRLSSLFQINPKNYVEDDTDAAFIPMEKIDATYLSSFSYSVRKWSEIKSGFTHFADGDVAFAKITPCFQNRKSMILRGLPNGIGAGTTELKVLRTYGNTISTEYLLFFLESPYFTEEAIFKGTANQQRIITGYLENKLFPLPPLNEQQLIVNRIKSSFVVAETYGNAQEKLDSLNNSLAASLRKSILQEAIQGKLVPQDPNDEPASFLLQRIKEERLRLVKEGKLKKKDVVDSVIFKGDDNKYYEQIGKTVTDISEEIPFNIPDKWAWSRLSGVVNIIMGQSPDGNDVFEADKVNDAYEFHQGKISFTDKYIAPSGKWCRKPPRIADIGSLLVCVRAPIGDVNITQRQIGIGRGLAAITGYKGIAPDFLFYWLLAHKRLLIDKGTGSTFKAITVEVLKDLIIPLPPLVEQQRIVSQIKKLYDRIKGI